MPLIIDINLYYVHNDRSLACSAGKFSNHILRLRYRIFNMTIIDIEYLDTYV